MPHFHLHWILISLLPHSGAAAADGDWSGKGEAGFVMARGNSETDTGNAKVEIAYERRKWKQSLQGSGLYGTSNEIKSGERWDARWQTDYKFSDRTFVFLAMRYEQDHFSGFDYQSSATTGLGHKFIDSERTRLTGSLGGGYGHLRPEQLIKDDTGNVIQRIKGEPTKDVVGNAGVDYEQQITSNTKLIDRLLVEWGPDNTFVHNEFAIQVAMTDTFALGFGYGVRHNTEPPPGLARTDRLTTANLVYNFK